MCPMRRYRLGRMRSTVFIPYIARDCSTAALYGGLRQDNICLFEHPLTSDSESVTNDRQSQNFISNSLCRQYPPVHLQIHTAFCHNRVKEKYLKDSWQILAFTTSPMRSMMPKKPSSRVCCRHTLKFSQSRTAVQLYKWWRSCICEDERRHGLCCVSTLVEVGRLQVGSF